MIEEGFDVNVLDGSDFVDIEWWEETSRFDEHPTTRWAHGVECYERLYRCRVPATVVENDTVDDWISDNWDYIKWLD